MEEIEQDLPGKTPLEPEELDDLRLHLATKEDLNIAEARNILNARVWALGNLKLGHSLLEIDSLKELHRRMFGDVWNWAGRFRLTEKSIGIEPYRISVELRNLRDDAQVWTYSEPEFLARLHHRLVWIHPFPNGNGRHARLVTDLYARHRNWVTPSWGARFSTARSAYLEALRLADRGDFGLLIEFMQT